MGMSLWLCCIALVNRLWHLDGKLSIVIVCEKEKSTQTLAYLCLVTDQAQIMNLLDWINLLKEMVWNPSGRVLKSRLNKILENWLQEGVFCWQTAELDDLRRVLCLKFLTQRQTEISDGSWAQGLQTAFSRDGEFKCTCSSWCSVTQFLQRGVVLWVALVWWGNQTFRGR